MTLDSPMLTAVICTRNRSDLIGKAVRSVLANDHPSFELVVIDQSDSDATGEALLPLLQDRRLRYFHTTKVGLSAAYNAALAAGRGELFAFTDDDCIAPPDWLTSVEHEFTQDPEAGLIYGNVEGPSDAYANGIIPQIVFDSRRRIGGGDAFELAGMGANFAARRVMLEKIGGFDEALGGGGPLRSSQDFDLQFRLYRASGVSVLCPTLRVTHYGLRTSEQWPTTQTAYGVGDGAFYMKHVRCGDLLAARMLLREFCREVAKSALRPVRRNKPHSTNYLRGLIRGSFQSFRFSIDRGRRLYVYVAPQSP